MSSGKDENPVNIHRVKDRKDPFVVLQKTALEDSRLTWEARGIWGYLMCKPDTWIVRVGDLVKRGDRGKGKIYSLLQELVRFGYMAKHETRNKSGQFEFCTWKLHEVPKKNLETLNKTVSEGSKMVKPDVVKPDAVEGDLSKERSLPTKHSYQTTTTTEEDYDIPDFLLNYESQGKDLLRMARPDDRSIIIDQISNDIERANRGERDEIKNVMLYLESLCNKSRAGKYYHNAKKIKSPVNNELIYLRNQIREKVGGVDGITLLIKEGGESEELLEQLEFGKKEIDDLKNKITMLMNDGEN